jgi:hypothetical protein
VIVVRRRRDHPDKRERTAPPDFGPALAGVVQTFAIAAAPGGSARGWEAGDTDLDWSLPNACGMTDSVGVRITATNGVGTTVVQKICRAYHD